MDEMREALAVVRAWEQALELVSKSLVLVRAAREATAPARVIREMLMPILAFRPISIAGFGMMADLGIIKIGGKSDGEEGED